MKSCKSSSSAAVTRKEAEGGSGRGRDGRQPKSGVAGMGHGASSRRVGDKGKGGARLMTVGLQAKRAESKESAKAR